MNDSDFDKDVKKLNTHLQLFCDNIPVILTRFENERKNPNSIQWFTLGMLQRLLNASFALKILIPAYQSNRAYDFGIGILIRSIVLDGLIGMNLLRILKNSLSEKLEQEKLIYQLDEFCRGILADGLVQTLRYFEQLQSNNLVEKDDLFKMYNHFAETYSDFILQPKGINTLPHPRLRVQRKPFQYFDSLVKDPEMREIGHSFYELYIIYSKYDHFGFLYFEVMKAERELKNDRISAAINLFVNHFANLCDLLDRVTPENTVVKNSYLVSKKYLEQKQKDQK